MCLKIGLQRYSSQDATLVRFEACQQYTRRDAMYLAQSTTAMSDCQPLSWKWALSSTTLTIFRSNRCFWRRAFTLGDRYCMLKAFRRQKGSFIHSKSRVNLGDFHWITNSWCRLYISGMTTAIWRSPVFWREKRHDIVFVRAMTTTQTTQLQPLVWHALSL